MIMRKMFVASAMVALSVVSGCTTFAPASSVQWTDETPSQISVGMSKADVTALLGAASATSSKSDGTEVWVFRKASDENGLGGAYISAVALGARSGENALIVDVLTVEFVGGLVSSYTYDQRVNNNIGLEKIR